MGVIAHRRIKESVCENVKGSDEILDNLLYKSNVIMLRKFYDNYYLDMNEKLFGCKKDYRMAKIIDSLLIDIDKYDEKLQNKLSDIIYNNANKFDIELNDLQIGLDGLCGWKQLYRFYDGEKEWIEAYRILRGSYYGNWIWPNKREDANTINQLRASKLGDRIDHTLFDIKMYYEYKDTEEIRDKCKMHNAFENRGTREFFDRIGNFDKFSSIYKLSGLFVESGEVIDLSSRKKFIDEKMHAEFEGHARWYIFDKNYLEKILQICTVEQMA